MNNEENKYGYCITTTPGLLGDGVYPLSTAAILRGEIKRASIVADFGEPMATFASKGAAEKAMREISGGEHPSVYAGLDVLSAFEFPEFCLYGMTQMIG